MPFTHSGEATQETPMRQWNIEVHLLGPHGEDLPADCFEKVVYKLHETFEARATQSRYTSTDSKPAPSFTSSAKPTKLIVVLCTAFKTPPFRIQEKGWGEFDMLLLLTPKDKGAEIQVAHDLNFQSEHYETKHPIASPSTSSYHA